MTEHELGKDDEIYANAGGNERWQDRREYAALREEVEQMFDANM